MTAMERLHGVDRRYLLAAAVGVTAIGAGIYLRKHRRQTKAADQEYDAAATSADSRWQAAPDGAAADGKAQPPQAGGAAAADDAASGSAQAAPPDGAESTGAAPKDPIAVRGVSTLHASNRVRRGLDDRWCWSEDETDVVLEIASDVKSAKDVRIKFEPTYLALSVNGECIIDGRLCRPVHAEECSWQFEGCGKERTIVVTLVKALAAVSWDRVLL